MIQKKHYNVHIFESSFMHCIARLGLESLIPRQSTARIAIRASQINGPHCNAAPWSLGRADTTDGMAVVANVVDIVVEIVHSRCWMWPSIGRGQSKARERTHANHQINEAIRVGAYFLPRQCPASAMLTTATLLTLTLLAPPALPLPSKAHRLVPSSWPLLPSWLSTPPLSPSLP
jgi:hypothetical protein